MEGRGRVRVLIRGRSLASECNMIRTILSFQARSRTMFLGNSKLLGLILIDELIIVEC